MEEKQITLQIDGHFITVPEGSTILEAACKIIEGTARSMGIEVVG